MSNPTDIGVLHVMMNPFTGPWSVIKQLACAQMASGLYQAVGLGIITDRCWPRAYEDELRQIKLKTYRRNTPKVFGTAQHLFQLVRRPGIENWIGDFAATACASRIVVHFHNAWTSGVFLPLKQTRTPVKTVVTFHGIAGAPSLRRQPVRRAIHRYFAQRLVTAGARLTSVDAGNLAAAEELFGLAREQFTIIPNGMTPGADNGRPFCRGSERLTLAHVGSLTEGKGWRVAAESVIALAKAGKKIRFIIAGSGPEEAVAVALAAEHPDCISYLGRISDPVKTLLPEVDLFVLMTNNDGLPMAIIEAMSCGIPVISTKIGGIPAAVLDGESGRIIPRTSESLADVVREIYEHPAMLEAFSRKTRTIFQQKFHIGNVIEAYHRIYCGADGISHKN
jgi:glycosyltransferase involved in cell wall biosynthesis